MCLSSLLLWFCVSRLLVLNLGDSTGTDLLSISLGKVEPRHLSAVALILINIRSFYAIDNVPNYILIPKKPKEVILAIFVLFIQI